MDNLVPCVKILRLNRGIYTTANGHKINIYTHAGKADSIPEAADVLVRNYPDAAHDDFVFLETVQPKHLQKRNNNVKTRPNK